MGSREETHKLVCLARRDQRLPCDRGSRLRSCAKRSSQKCGETIDNLSRTTHENLNIEAILQDTEQRSCTTQNIESERMGASAIVQGVVGEGSRRRLQAPLLTARAPWNPQLSWTWQTSCDGRTLFLSNARYAAQAVTVDDATC